MNREVRSRINQSQGLRRESRDRRSRSLQTFEDMWDRGPTNLRVGNDVPPAAAHAMTWFHFIMRLCHTRPIPRRVREDPSLLAKPLARETGWSLQVCSNLVGMMLRKTARQIVREEREIDLPED